MERAVFEYTGQTPPTFISSPEIVSDGLGTACDIMVVYLWDASDIQEVLDCP
ncbi:hypothetical protein SISSUDRAFT_1056391 [Sistotremastrum suecicum HHB10207 ss-3]|uniref:Uncharacterized protein n=1 Tax=Sistotremastrum suecicum HHB10207 ss-3 TaxID=1314776 RepID=A0A165WYG6_9AGAM|nr:hypothetical protein SISSUDRAFT_1056391 [Sistotremastrum suecicum HHB10207 ss-3]